MRRTEDKHPVGLKQLGRVEMWERDSYYTMMALLMMYMTKQLGIDQGIAAVIYGIYIALVYFSPLAFGSLANNPLIWIPLADRAQAIRSSLLELTGSDGSKLSIIASTGKLLLTGLSYVLAFIRHGIVAAARGVASVVTKITDKTEAMERILTKGPTPFELAFAGGIVMMLGHIILGVHGKTALFIAMAHIIVGNGLFKPNMGALVNGLYPAGSKLQKIGFNIFYMYVNIGALIAPIVGGKAKVLWGYHAGFTTAAFGMLLGLIWFWRSRKDILHANSPSSIAAVTGVEITDSKFHDHEEEETPESRYQVNVRIKGIFAASLVLVLFFMSFHQNGSTMALVASDNTVRAWLSPTAPPATRATVVSYELVKPKDGGKPTKAILVLGSLPQGIEKESSVAIKNPDGYLDLAEVKDAPSGTSLTVTPPFHVAPQVGSTAYGPSAYWEITEIYQAAINPVFIILLTQILIRSRRAERWYKRISLPSTIMLGMALAALGSWVMAVSAHVGGNTGRVSVIWIVLGYFVTTCSEMFVSPVSLALVAKLSPRRMTSTMLGVMYLCTAIGNTLAGYYGKFWPLWSHSTFFWFLGGTSALAIPFVYFNRKLLLEALSYLPKEKDEEEVEAETEVVPKATPSAPIPAH